MSVCLLFVCILVCLILDSLETKTKIWLKKLTIIDLVLSMLDLKNKTDKIIIAGSKKINF